MNLIVRENEADNTVERLFANINQTGFARHVEKCNVAAHARRLYDSAESEIDEWVLNAIN